jgi:hypothetical protein
MAKNNESLPPDAQDVKEEVQEHLSTTSGGDSSSSSSGSSGSDSKAGKK